jgi:tRNA (mo5U34)-methyltransferase
MPEISMFNQWLNQFCIGASNSSVDKHIETIKTITEQVIKNINQGDLNRWLSAYQRLPSAETASVDYQQGPLTVHLTSRQGEKISESMEEALKGLHPWRKGPFKLGDCLVDSEWQSNLKWERIEKAIPPLKNKTVLDVGCGNGYYLMKMAAKQPQLLLGIEPGLLHNVQFWSIEKYAQTGAYVLPLKIQELPLNLNCFDVVFSMGVLYHRKSPIKHLEHLKSLMSAGGTLIIETLIVDGSAQTCLVPQGRYAQMRNVWFLPSVEMLKGWLLKLGFKSIEVVDVSVTTLDEQRTTEWMKFHSLKEFLSADLSQTIEGHPPPKRVVISCRQ